MKNLFAASFLGIFFCFFSGMPLSAQWDFGLDADDSEETTETEEDSGFSFGVEEESDATEEDSEFSLGGEEDLAEEADSEAESGGAQLAQLDFPLAGSAAGESAVLKVAGLEWPFRWCPAGKFRMGSLADEEGREVCEMPHEVEFAEGFWMLETEVTLKMFSAFVRETGYRTEAEKDGRGGFRVEIATGKILGPDTKNHWRQVGFRQDDRFPVVNVTWNDAVAFVRWLQGKMVEKGGEEGNQIAVQLPSESQWEYACRADTQTAYVSGNAPHSLARYANVRDRALAKKMNLLEGMELLPWSIDGENVFCFTAPVGQFLPNAWGIYDMHGNVWEWCRETWEGTELRLARGGAWNTDYRFVRSAARGRYSARYRYVNLGFRIV
ncbi:MAG: formylglycine-generating enzyme family protein, partial [Planctomycetia bacterium]|nr:formylglycine-generating enzyme family protein [Planctomycetia bacterium]